MSCTIPLATVPYVVTICNELNNGCLRVFSDGVLKYEATRLNSLLEIYTEAKKAFDQKRVSLRFIDASNKLMQINITCNNKLHYSTVLRACQ